MRPTKTDQAMAAAQETFADDPERAALIACARRFKASWLELGEALTRVRREGLWKGWGYGSFEEYGKSELHLRAETIEKLTGSYLFLQKRAPAVLGRDGLREPIPSYQAVDFLRRAEEEDNAGGEAMAEVRKLVLDDGASLASVARQYKDVLFPVSEGDRRARDASTLKSAAARLRDLLPETKAVPRKLAAEVASALERLLDALGAGEVEAA
jgi:hypothetical protein